MYKDAAGGLMGKKGIHYLMFDSWEAGCLNWTPKMFEAFREVCGYDLLKWLPALAGYVIESPESSDRFLWDFRHCGTCRSQSLRPSYRGPERTRSRALHRVP